MKLIRTTGQNKKNGKVFERESGPRVIAVTSGKGGVGKTNVVVNLAIACQRMGMRVLVLDGDLGLANLDIVLGINPIHTIAETIRGEMELSKVIVRGPEGVALIPASLGVQELTHLSEGQKLNLINEFDTLNEQFDLLLVDTGAGISSNVIFFNLAANERLIVVSPDPSSITGAYALMKVLFLHHGIKEFLLLSNMVRDKNEGKMVYENLSRVLATMMGGVSIEYTGCVPWDRLLQKGVGRRKPVVYCYPASPSGRAFTALAEFLLSRRDEKLMDGNIKFFLKRFMNGAGHESRTH
ncbi:MAG: MinD/ParA family protein [Deltaproteobacteria bacterium]|nr:MinD/ParA family protein [Deltaproteobacteria bacterium]